MLFAPPFGEEMNKSRRQVAATAEHLVAAGYAVVVPDLFGTGDSAGDFSDATWDTWRSNLVSTITWSVEQGLPVQAVIALRLGCVLAAQALKEAEHQVARTAFWQPVESGRQFMTQFLRLRVAASMMQDDAKETVEELKNRLRGGEVIEVAGYALGSDLWRAIEQLELTPSIDRRLGHLASWEIGPGAEGGLSVPGKRLLQSAIQHGLNASAERLQGEPFWSSTEIVVHPDLAQRTAAFISAGALP